MTTQVRLDQTGAVTLRHLWNEWDPIGVGLGPEDDEYDSYLTPTLELLESEATVEVIVQYLEHLVGEHMGMGEEAVKHSNPLAFAELLRAWQSARKEARDDL
ncbi:MAG: hypothetical protein EOO23_05190 [Comamonadaceae bacterium]|nr:MAG: hypothetical protein EOO23_05190 [Comamonadaceae bacterium]